MEHKKSKIYLNRRYLARYDTRRLLRHRSCPHTRVGCCYLPRYRYDRKRVTQTPRPKLEATNHKSTLRYHQGVSYHVPRVINRWFVKNVHNYHRGVVSCGGCDFLRTGDILLCQLRCSCVTCHTSFMRISPTLAGRRSALKTSEKLYQVPGVQVVRCTTIHTNKFNLICG